MKNVKKTITTILILTMLCSMTAFAAESIYTDEPTALAQIENDSKTELLTCSSTAGTVYAVVGCIYSASWEEGYAGNITSAYFSVDNITVNGTKYTASEVGNAWSSGSSMYKKYKAGSVTVRVGITCDEWGNITMNMQQA